MFPNPENLKILIDYYLAIALIGQGDLWIIHSPCD